MARIPAPRFVLGFDDGGDLARASESSRALALVRYRIPGRNLITMLLIAPILVPEVVLAVALLLFLNFLDLGKSF